MRSFRANIFLVLFLSIIIVPVVATPPPRYTLKAQLFEIMYCGHGETKIKSINAPIPIQISATPNPSEVARLIERSGQVANNFLSVRRPDLSYQFSDVVNGWSQIRSAFIFRFARGVKETEEYNLVPTSTSSLLSQLDKTKGYTLLPVLTGYNCDMVHLSFSDGNWIVKDEHADSVVSEIKCRAKQSRKCKVLIEAHRFPGNSRSDFEAQLYDMVEAPRSFRNIEFISVREEKLGCGPTQTSPATAYEMSRDTSLLLKLTVN